MTLRYYTLKWTGSFLLLLILCNFSVSAQEIIINANEKGATIAPSMYGIFFEEINHAGDGGLYAELVNNRSFEELEMPDGFYAEGNVLFPKKVHNHITGVVKPERYRWATEPVPAWSLTYGEGDQAEMELTKTNPKFDTAPNNLKVTISRAVKPVRLINRGYWGMNLVKGEKYDLRTIVRPSSDYKGKIRVYLLSEKEEILASVILKASNSNDWNDLKDVLVPSRTDAKGKLALEFDGEGTVYVDYVSLFPKNTFNNRSNGLRKDVAEILAGLRPSFVRWPGGCVVEGITLDNRFEWKKTLGDPAGRSGEYSTWGYRCSYGFGYYEMLQFCEDIGAEAMYVCNVGLGCQFRMADASSQDSIAYYLQDCMDAIEYAIGDASTTWGAKRAAAGHHEPFPLKYVEIGNENWGVEYDKRFDIFYKAIKEKYPELVLISNHGLNGTGKITQTDMVDPHWYVDSQFFFNNTTLFDKHPRGKYTVYVGEYACNKGVKGGNMTAALSEAAFISGMERNGDLVTMTSYAPLLENRNDRSWSVNLIWLDTDQVVGRSSYYVQKMAAENCPTYNVKSNVTLGGEKPIQFADKGRIGFGSWKTQVEFKDIVATTTDGKSISLNVNKSPDIRGQWTSEGGVLSQTLMESATRYVIENFGSNHYTLNFKIRKTGGDEGFMIYYGLSDDYKKGYTFNIAGWGNTKSSVEYVTNGKNSGTLGESIPTKIETGKWNDVKMVVTPGKSELYLNGKLLIEHSPKSSPTHFISSGYDENTNELILKVVNADNEPYATTVRLEGVGKVKNTGKVITLSATSGEEENSFEEPQKIYPSESTFNKFGETFTYKFAPFSYTIMRIKAQ